LKFSTGTDYVGALVYKNGDPETVWTDEGRIKVDIDTTFNSWLDTLTSIVHYDTLINFKSRYQYFIQDHLGNNRVIFEKLNDSLYVAQRMDYYPFGSPFEADSLDFRFTYQGKEYIDFLGLNQFDFHSRTYDSYLGRFSQVDGANQFASGYTGMGNNPVSFIDPSGQIAFIPFLIAGAIGGFSGYKIGKAARASGWGLAGYTLAGAGIGVATVGVGNSVLGGFSAAATSGMTLGPSALAYGAAGAASGAFQGGAYAALSGQNIGSGILSGAGWGAAGGVLSGGLQHLGFLNKLNNSPSFAQNDPIYYGGELKGFTARAPKLYTSGNLKSVGSYLGYAGYGELGLSATQMAMSYRRSRLPIHSRVGSFTSFSRIYGTVGKFAKGAGAVSNLGEGVNVISNSIDYYNGDISTGRFAYRTTGSVATIGSGIAAGSALGPPGAFVGAGVGSAFSIGESVYDGVNWWLGEMSKNLGNLEYNLKNSIPNFVPR
jgi:RHS repeat-associated protein